MTQNLLETGIQQGIVEKTQATKKLTIDGITQTYPVYKIRLDALYYNDKNDRIATWISEYKSKNDFDFSDKEKYNKILEHVILVL